MGWLISFWGNNSHRNFQFQIRMATKVSNQKEAVVLTSLRNEKNTVTPKKKHEICAKTDNCQINLVKAQRINLAMTLTVDLTCH